LSTRRQRRTNTFGGMRRDVERAHAVKLAFIRRLCLSAESMHVETARLVTAVSTETRYASSAAPLKPKPRKSLKP
jgi:hypothetical protein